MTLTSKMAALAPAVLVASAIAGAAMPASAQGLPTVTQAADVQLAQRFNPNDVSGARDEYLRKRRLCYRLRYMIYRSRNPAMRRYYRARYYRLCRGRF